MVSPLSIYFSLWLIFQMTQPVSSFKCYVCAPDEGKPEDMYTLSKSFPANHLQSCSKYNKNNKHLYLLDCPSGNSGCLTKFEASGSVMRSCAPIAIEDCKEANGVNYCYCKTEGCNTPDRKLAEPHTPTLGKAQAAARLSPDQNFNRFYDDEDLSEGSGQWGDFYYDDYWDTGTGDSELRHHGGHPSGHDIDDTEHGDGIHDDSDMTEPPPYLDLEEPKPSHKYNRPRVTASSDSDITISEDKSSEDGAKPSSAARSLFSPALSLLLLLLLSQVLVRI